MLEPCFCLHQVEVVGIVVAAVTFQNGAGEEIFVQQLFGERGKWMVGLKQCGAVVEALAQTNGVHPTRVSLEERSHVVVFATYSPKLLPGFAKSGWWVWGHGAPVGDCQRLR